MRQPRATAVIRRPKKAGDKPPMTEKLEPIAAQAKADLAGATSISTLRLKSRVCPSRISRSLGPYRP
jgi:hypothetical protein